MEARITELDLEIALREADAYGLESTLARENGEKVDAGTVSRALGLLVWRIETGDDEQQKTLLHLVIEEIAIAENAEVAARSAPSTCTSATRCCRCWGTGAGSFHCGSSR